MMSVKTKNMALFACSTLKRASVSSTKVCKTPRTLKRASVSTKVSGFSLLALLPPQVPGLFEGDEFTTLMTQCKEGSQREGLMLDSAEELYKWFTQQVSGSLPAPYLYLCIINVTVGVNHPL